MHLISSIARLNAEEQIQMVTALLLQLIQCVVKLPRPEKEKNVDESDETERQRREREKAEMVSISFDAYLQE